MPLALVTGPQEHLGPAAATLGRAGFNVVTWDTAAPPPLPGDPFDCYVQLPCAEATTAGSGISARGAGQIGTADRRPPEDLVCRIDRLAAVASRLGPNASVLIGVEEADLSAAPQPGALAPDLLAAVALALLEDLGRPAARVAVLPVADLCRPVQWEMPTPPRVSAP
jgi:hypothetical protein